MTRQQIAKLLEPVLEDCTDYSWCDDFNANNIGALFDTMAEYVQQAIDALNEPDPRVISLTQTINQMYDESINVEKLLGKSINLSKHLRNTAKEQANGTQPWVRELEGSSNES